MANFKTHTQFSAIGSAFISTALVSTYSISFSEACLCWLAGTLGGILPDIDSDNSHSLTILFGLFTLIACAGSIAYSIHQYPIIWVWGICMLVYCLMQFVVRKLFEQLTTHRGIFHSIFAGVAAGLLTTWGAYSLGYSATSSWFLGAFLTFGFILHLLLDEIYSVDFMNVAIKRSFGTAIKLFDYRNIKTGLIFAFLIAVLLVNAPPHDRFIDKLSTLALFESKVFSLNLLKFNEYF